MFASWAIENPIEGIIIMFLSLVCSQITDLPLGPTPLLVCFTYVMIKVTESTWGGIISIFFMFYVGSAIGIAGAFYIQPCLCKKGSCSKINNKYLKALNSAFQT